MEAKHINYYLIALALFSVVNANAQITKKIFARDGKMYVEETEKRPDGSVITTTRPMGQEKITPTTVSHPNGSVTETTKVIAPGMSGTISVTNSKDEVQNTRNFQNSLNDALADCRQYQTSVPHPLMPNETMKLQVHGMVNGKCKYTQTMPNGGLQTCQFSDQQRKELKSNSGQSLVRFMQDPGTCIISGY